MTAGALTWFIGMRTGWRPVLDLQRRINRDYLNPRTLRQDRESTAVVHHTGRSSGREYRTPVGAAATADGFAIASVYGTGSDWIRNVIAGGPTQIEVRGSIYPVLGAGIVPIGEVAHCFSPADQRGHRLFGVREAVRLRVGEPRSVS